MNKAAVRWNTNAEAGSKFRSLWRAKLVNAACRRKSKNQSEVDPFSFPLYTSMQWWCGDAKIKFSNHPPPQFHFTAWKHLLYFKQFPQMNLRWIYFGRSVIILIINSWVAHLPQAECQWSSVKWLKRETEFPCLFSKSFLTPKWKEERRGGGEERGRMLNDMISDCPQPHLLPSTSHTGSSLLLVLPQPELCEVVGHLQRLLQTLRVPACGLGWHVLAASFAVQQGTQLLNPLAGLQTTVGHILSVQGRNGGEVKSCCKSSTRRANCKSERVSSCVTWGTWHRQVILPASGSTVKSIAAVWGDCVFSSFSDSFRAWEKE